MYTHVKAATCYYQYSYLSCLDLGYPPHRQFYWLNLLLFHARSVIVEHRILFLIRRPLFTNAASYSCMTARWSLARSLARQQTHPRQLRSESVVILFLTVLRLYVGLHALCKFGRACIQKRVRNIYAPYAAPDHSLTIIITMFRRRRAFLFAAMTLAQLGVCTSQIGEYIYSYIINT